MSLISCRAIVDDSGQWKKKEVDIAFAVNISCSQLQTYAISIRLSSDIVKKAGLKLGDKADLLFDASNRIGLITKVTGSGWKLTKPGHEKRVRLGIPWRPGMPCSIRVVAFSANSADKNGIKFTFPDSISFEKSPQEMREDNKAR